MTQRILITGASGSGTTTLGRELARQLACAHLDADDCYWLPTVPPYQQKRPAAQRFAMVRDAMRAAPRLVLSGSVLGWGAEVEDGFDLIVFLYVEADLRIERLRRRETGRFGAPDPAFLEWAAQYDAGPPEGRSLAKHTAWLAARRCPVLRLEGDQSTAERVGRVLQALAAG